jgi:peptidyl-prolyl cis-trans isomerase B (cyclophilin B)
LQQLEEYLHGRYIGARNTRLQTYVNQPENKAILDSLTTLMQSQDLVNYEAYIEALVPELEAKFGQIRRYELSDLQRKTYTAIGGTPHLDDDYTVFGEVVEGIELIDALCAIPTGPNDRPVNDTRMAMTVERVSKKELKERYGYEPPLK